MATIDHEMTVQRQRAGVRRQAKHPLRIEMTINQVKKYAVIKPALNELEWIKKNQ